MVDMVHLIRLVPKNAVPILAFTQLSRLVKSSDFVKSRAEIFMTKPRLRVW